MGWPLLLIATGLMMWIACLTSLAIYGMVLISEKRWGWGLAAVSAAAVLVLLGALAVRRFG